MQWEVEDFPGTWGTQCSHMAVGAAPPRIHCVHFVRFLLYFPFFSGFAVQCREVMVW